MPDWYELDRAVPAEPLGRAVVEAVERDRRELFYPPHRPAAAIVHGISPRPGRRMLRRIIGTGAPRRESCRSTRRSSRSSPSPRSELPEGEDWRYEPKWDGFRTIVFRDGDEVHLQSRNGKPMNRYFPEVVEQVLDARRTAVRARRRDDGGRSTASRSSTCSPSASTRPPRGWSGCAKETPAALVAFDLLAEGDEALLELPYDERRERLAALVGGPGPAHPDDRPTATRRRQVADRELRGRDRQAGRAAPYQPGRAQGDGEDQARAHRRRRGGGLPLRQGAGHGGLADPRPVRRGRQAPRHGPHLGLHGQAEARADRRCSSPTGPASAAPASRAAGSPTRSSSGRGCGRSWSCEVAFDHITGNRIRHGAKFLRWRTDKEPRECHHLATPRLTLLLIVLAGASRGAGAVPVPPTTRS